MITPLLLSVTQALSLGAAPSPSSAAVLAAFQSAPAAVSQADAQDPASPAPGPAEQTPAPAAEPQRGAELEPAPLPEPEAVEVDRALTDQLAPAEPPLAMADEIARVEAWFEGLDTLRARFEQIGPDGRTLAGGLWLDRPGRVRFDYDDPSPVLIVADGATVAIADSELETVDRAPIRSTPLRWLLQADLDLAASGAVVEAGRYEGRLYATFEDPGGEAEGRLTLIFDDPDAGAPADAMSLAGWYAVDAVGGLTEVALSQTERGLDLDPRLFVLEDADAGDRRRRR